MSDRQKLFYALLASALFHALLAFVLTNWAVGHSREVADALPDLAQLEVTIMPAQPAPAPAPPPPVIAPATPPPSHIVRQVLDSDGLTPSKQAPAHALFESDANMQAGSQLPATGNLPLPSQLGPSRKFIGFKDQASSFGNGSIAAPDAPASRPAPAAQQPPRKMAPQADRAAEAAAPTPAPTPTPSETVAAKTDDAGFALGRATPTPPPARPSPTPFEMARLNPSLLRGHADDEAMTPPTPPSPPSPAQPEPGMQQEIEKTRVDGGITRRGAPGVDAVESPFGKYHRMLGTLIGSRWNHYVKTQPDLITVGDVTILIKIDTSGKVTEAKVIANHANDGLAALSIKAIMDCKLPPIPDDLAPMLNDGKLEIPYTFNVYDPNQ